MELILHLSLVFPVFFTSIWEGEKKLISIEQKNDLKQAEKFLEVLEEILKKENKQLKDIRKIYFVSGPGSQTGVRISLTFISILSVLNKEVKVFCINSLLFQAKRKSISAIDVDKGGKKSHLAVFDADLKEVISQTIKTREEINEIRKNFSDFSFFHNFKDLSFLDLFEEKLPYFNELINLEKEIEKIADKNL